MGISSIVKYGVFGALVSLVAGCMDTASTPVDGPVRSFQTVTYNHWDVRGRFTTRDQVFQNVTQKDLMTLLSGKTFVGYEESDGSGLGYGAITVRHFMADGNVYSCLVSYKTGSPEKDAYGGRPKQWVSSSAENKNLGLEVFEIETIEFDGSSTYATIQYNGLTGQIAHVGYENNRFRDIRKGHLQNGIPAAVYTACPTYPSAESLGTFVNHNQTAWNYFELLEQDAGDRVIRPDLVTAFTPVPLNSGETR